MENQVNYSTKNSVCSKCGTSFEQAYKPELKEFTSFKSCGACRIASVMNDTKTETILEILELVGKKGLSIKEIREVLNKSIRDFERVIEETVITNATRKN